MKYVFVFLVAIPLIISGCSYLPDVSRSNVIPGSENDGPALSKGRDKDSSSDTKGHESGGARN